MKKFLILLAGPPATGKSYLVGKLKDTFPDLFSITPDEIKELYAESEGFDNLDEKKKQEEKVWKFYYQLLELYMEAGKRLVLSEYPFSDKQKSRLQQLAKTYDYNIITIRLVADFDILWERRRKRDREPNRHLSYIMTHYHYGDELDNRELADNHISKEEFRQIIENRKYNEFELGDLFEVNVSDYNQVNYDELIERLKKVFKGE